MLKKAQALPIVRARLMMLMGAVNLTAQERDVVALRMMGLSCTMIGVEIHYCTRQVERIVSSAADKLVRAQSGAGYVKPAQFARCTACGFTQFEIEPRCFVVASQPLFYGS